MRPWHFAIIMALLAVNGIAINVFITGDMEWVITFCFMLAIAVFMFVVAYREDQA